MLIKGTVAVVSGASAGIGAATARALAAAGADEVVLLARRAEALGKVEREIKAGGGHATSYPVDLADRSATMRVAEKIRAESGEPDILINNAGAGRWLFAEETDVEEAAVMMAVPYGAAFCLTRAFLPSMLARRSGHIVNITSPAAFLSWPGATAYSAARWAMRGFTEALDAETRGTGVGVSLVVPGKVKSDYFAANPGSEARIPSIAKIYRTLTPDEVAQLIVRAIEHRSRLVIRPRLLGATIWWSRLFPSSTAAVLRWSGARRVPQAAMPEGDETVRQG